MDVIRECPGCPDRFYVIDEQPEIVDLSGPDRMEALGLAEEAVIAEARAAMDRMVGYATERIGDRFEAP